MKELYKNDRSFISSLLTVLIYAVAFLFFAYILVSLADVLLGTDAEWNFFRVLLEIVKGGR